MPLCRILLTPLSEKESSREYSAKGLKYLTGNAKFNPALNFSRQEFITHKVDPQKGMSISGFQPKLQVIIQDNQFDIIDEKGDFILKPSPEEYPYLAENEHATMCLMKKLKFEVPPHGLVYFQNTVDNQPREYAFVIKRYDRDEQGAIHQEQLDGAMNISEKYGKLNNKQCVSYERVAKFILKHTNDNLAVRTELFKRIVYAYLLGNNDLHLRNFSLIHLRNSEYRLAPVYDFVSVAPYSNTFNSTILALPLLAKEENEGELATGFNTKYGTYLGMDFVEFGENIGLSERLAKQLLIDLSKERETVEKAYQQSFMPNTDIEKVLQCYHQRLGYLQCFDEPLL